MYGLFTWRWFSGIETPSVNKKYRLGVSIITNCSVWRNGVSDWLREKIPSLLAVKASDRVWSI
jgi:hypothetical protein